MRLQQELETRAAPILIARGIVITEGGRRRSNNIQVVGVDARFGEIGGSAELFGSLSSDESLVNLHSGLQDGFGCEAMNSSCAWKRSTPCRKMRL